MIREVFRRFLHSHSPLRACALAYATLLALVPLLIVGLWVLQFFAFFNGIGKHIQYFIFNNFVPDASREVIYYLERFEAQSAHLPIFSTLALFTIVIMLFIAVDKNFNDSWQLPRKRHVGVSFIYSWIILLMGPLCLASSVFISSYLASLSLFDHITWVGRKHFLFIIPFLCSFTAFTVLYKLLPHTRVKWQHAAIGGFIAMTLFEFAKRGFGLYVIYFPTYNILYGALATIPLLCIWVYCSWLIFFFCGQLVNVLRLGKKEN